MTCKKYFWYGAEACNHESYEFLKYQLRRYKKLVGILINSNWRLGKCLGGFIQFWVWVRIKEKKMPIELIANHGCHCLTKVVWRGSHIWWSKVTFMSNFWPKNCQTKKILVVGWEIWLRKIGSNNYSTDRKSWIGGNGLKCLSKFRCTNLSQ